ncbi:MAG: hypothetical protein BYD32DRAFT_417457 [Podila humilis]|nr:MAG: hypothetical protein BYD32DRAFT_417457 [Podila humilis]
MWRVSTYTWPRLLFTGMMTPFRCLPLGFGPFLPSFSHGWCCEQLQRKQHNAKHSEFSKQNNNNKSIWPGEIEREREMAVGRQQSSFVWTWSKGTLESS